MRLVDLVSARALGFWHVVCRHVVFFFRSIGVGARFAPRALIYSGWEAGDIHMSCGLDGTL